MTTTTNYGYNVVDGSDQVNIQNQIAPNFTAIDADLKAVSDAATTVATHTVAGTVHQLVRNDSDRAVLRFVATGDFATGDTFTVDGLSVTARLVNGEALQTGCFKINNCVEAVLVGTVLNVNAVNPTVSDAGDVTYDNTGSGLTATNVQDAIDEVKADIPSIPASYAASAITYNNALSGLSATNVQAAIDELKALIPSGPTYITTGLTTEPNITLIDGGYYIDDNNIVHVDITIYTGVSKAANAWIVRGFPAAAGSGSGTITPAFNALAMYRENPYTGLVCTTSMSVGETRHFIGSYQMA